MTRPTVIPAAAADYLGDDAIVLGLEVNGEARAYPLLIMNWHEIVNDTLGGSPVAVTYCPLCGTGIAFDPIVDGKALEFGQSGGVIERGDGREVDFASGNHRGGGVEVFGTVTHAAIAQVGLGQ